MKLRIPNGFISYSMILAIILNGGGCAHSHVIQTHDLGSHNDKKIVVFTHECRVIQFAESEYRIDTSKVVKTISGEGLVLKDSISTMNKRFSGSIEFSQIDSIHVSEFSPLSNAGGWGIVIIGSATVLLLFFAWIIIGPISIG